jgi:AraC-like DNA-binding protein
MDYQLYLPDERLAPYVKCYWSLTNEAQNASRERVFPDGCIELIFNTADLMRKYDSATSFHIQPRSFIHGQLTKYIEIEPTGETKIFSARFQPGGLQRFIDFEAGELTGITKSIAEIWGDAGKALEKEIIASASDTDKIKIIERFLTARLDLSKKHDTDAEYCVNQIVETNGSASIAEIAARLHIGKRQLERKFVTAVGLPPKMLARILRFQHTLQLIENHEFISFTQVAYDGGFYDQAHFIKDFRQFTGLNPKKYFSENLEMAKFFVFD